MSGQNGLGQFTNTSSLILSGSNLADVQSADALFNPAANSNIEKLRFTAGIRNYHFIQALNAGTLDFGYRLNKIHTLNVQLTYTGEKVFNQTGIALGYSLNLSDATSLGVRFHGFSFKAPESNGAIYSGTFSLGGLTKLSNAFSVGFSTFNPIGFFRKEKSSDLNHDFRVGIGWYASEGLSIMVAGSLVGTYPFNISGGIKYKISNQIAFMISGQTNPSVFGLGMAVHLNKKSRIDLGAVHHLELGLSPAINFSYGQ